MTVAGHAPAFAADGLAARMRRGAGRVPGPAAPAVAGRHSARRCWTRCAGSSWPTASGCARCSATGAGAAPAQPDDARGSSTAAAALELFHAFALIHDDIIDGSDRRRGQPRCTGTSPTCTPATAGGATRARYGATRPCSAATCARPGRTSMFTECRAAAGLDPPRHQLFTVMRAEVVAGEYLDLVVRRGRRVGGRRADRDPDEGGPVLGDPAAADRRGPGRGASRRCWTRCRPSASRSGRRSSCATTCSGCSAIRSITGKSVLDDLREGKPTVLIALARANADRAQADRSRICSAGRIWTSRAQKSCVRSSPPPARGITSRT